MIDVNSQKGGRLEHWQSFDFIYTYKSAKPTGAHLKAFYKISPDTSEEKGSKSLLMP